MSLSRNNSSTDEFYDAFETIDEIPSSSREDSTCITENDSGVVKNGSSLRSIEEDEDVVIENAIAKNVNSKSRENDDNFEPMYPSSHINGKGMNEDPSSASCLLNNNSIEHNNYSRESRNESNENPASARCVLEHAPSLIDIVSSSMSKEDEEADVVQVLRKEVVEKVSNNSNHSFQGNRLSDVKPDCFDFNDQIDSRQEQKYDFTRQDFSLQAHSLELESKQREIVEEYCSSIDQDRLNYNNHKNEACAKEHSLDNNVASTESHMMSNETAATILLNTEYIRSSKEESSCSDRESANGFLPIDSDSTSTANAAPMTPTQEVKDPFISGTPNTETKLSTPLYQNAKRLNNDCSMLNFCDITSPLEALYLMCANVKRSATLKENSVEDLVDSAHDASPEKNSCSNDVDPPTAAPMSPREDYKAIPESDSDDDSSSAASFSSRNKLQIFHKDTGNTIDVRDNMKNINEGGENTVFDTDNSFLPSKRDLKRKTVTKGSSRVFEDVEGFNRLNTSLAVDSFETLSSVSYRDSPGNTTSKSYNSTGSTSTKTKTKLSDLKSSIANKLHNSTRSRKRTTSNDSVPRNVVPVKSASRQQNAPTRTASTTDLPPDSQHISSSSFNPMLLVKTIPKSHDGPAWCASFSRDGRFLATGGEDGNVCIWTVAPKSVVLHPDTAKATEKERQQGVHSPVEENTERANPINIDSPLTLDIDDMSTERVAIDTTQSEETAPPLNVVGSGPELATNLEILSSEPLQRFQDHTADVIDLSWSHTNFLLTASLDSSVRLYHYSKSQCLHLFQHANLVASVAFHPNNEQYFVSGGIDKKIRLWSITDGRVKDWAQAPDIITQVRFTPDGKYAVAGLFRGQVYFYDSDGLKYYTQMSCRNRSGRYKMGSKVTGISFVRGERDDWKRKSSIQGSELSTLENSFNKLTEASNRVVKRMSLPFKEDRSADHIEALRHTERMLVSTNDSRVRLYGLNDFCLIRKFKGHTNCSMQIRARLSESGDFIASGSESGHVFIWKTIDKKWTAKHNISTKLHKTKDKARSPDYFEASKAQLPIVTDSLFFPYKSVKEALLSSQVFPFQLSIDHIHDDLSSAAMLTLDYDGTMRVFLRKSCIDNLLDAATPRGGHLA